MGHRTLSVGLVLNEDGTPEGVREEVFGDREYTVIPVVALKEGVVWPVNAPRPELALKEEFARFPEAWNGRPVVAGHPEIDGKKVSANRLDVLDTYLIGNLYNTILEDDKLKSEIWIDKNQLESASEEVQDSVERLLSGEVTEVSVGAFVTVEAAQGKFEGKEYFGVWRNVVPDHLAILPEGTVGACSVADGCGAPRLNNYGGHSMSTEDTDRSDNPQLNAAQSGDVDSVNTEPEELDGDKDKKSKKKKKRNMQVRNKQNNQSGQDVHDNSPPTAVEGSRNCSCGGSCRECFSGRAFGLLQEGLAVTASISDKSLLQALDVALNAVSKEEGQGFVFVLDVLQSDQNSGEVVYETFEGIFKRGYRLEDDKIVLDSNSVPVRMVLDFVPVEVEVLGQSGEEVTNMAENANAEKDATPKQGAPEGPKSLEEFISSAPEEYRKVLQEGLSLQQRHRQALIDKLKMCDRNPFELKELESMDTSMLEKLVEFGISKEVEKSEDSKDTYEGRRLAGARSTETDEVPPPIPVFKKSA